MKNLLKNELQNLSFSLPMVTKPGALVSALSMTWSFLKLLYSGLNFSNSPKKMRLSPKDGQLA